MPLMPQMLRCLALTRTPARDWRIASPFGRFPRSIDIVDSGDNHPQRANVGGVLDVPLLRVRQPNHRSRLDVRARGNHFLNIGELQRAVLHFEPGEVVMLGRLTVVGDIHLRLGKAENLLAIEKLLLGGVVEFRFRAESALCAPTWYRTRQGQK